MRVRRSEVIRHTRHARMHLTAAESFFIDDLSRRGLDERRASEEDPPLVLDDDDHVGHGGHVSAVSCDHQARLSSRPTGDADPVHDRDLRDTHPRHPRHVVEDPAKVVLP